MAPLRLVAAFSPTAGRPASATTLQAGVTLLVSVLAGVALVASPDWWVAFGLLGVAGPDGVRADPSGGLPGRVPAGAAAAGRLLGQHRRRAVRQHRRAARRVPDGHHRRGPGLAPAAVRGAWHRAAHRHRGGQRPDRRRGQVRGGRRAGHAVDQRARAAGGAGGRVPPGRARHRVDLQGQDAVRGGRPQRRDSGRPSASTSSCPASRPGRGRTSPASAARSPAPSRSARSWPSRRW